MGADTRARQGDFWESVRTRAGKNPHGCGLEKFLEVQSLVEKLPQGKGRENLLAVAHWMEAHHFVLAVEKNSAEER